MADNELSKLLETQISLTEWLAQIGHEDANELREEDNVKRVRIGQISDITGMPYDKPTTFPASELKPRSARVQQFIDEHGDELCALRLIPKKGVKAEKLRNRGKSITGAMSWFDSLDIDASLYDADFIPHFDDYSWSTIFVVNDKGIFGEIYFGGHHNLTQGFWEGKRPMTFAFDYHTWSIEPQDSEALTYLKHLITYVHIPEAAKQQALHQAVEAEFTHDFMKGYFESVHSPSVGTWFIDYNRLLGKRYEDYTLQNTATGSLVTGRVASQGQASGVVRVVIDPSKEAIVAGEILVCGMTTPDYIPHMVQAAAIITDQGGILCHAAIVARELHKPCIVGTSNATKVPKTGDRITILADGVVQKSPEK